MAAIDLGKVTGDQGPQGVRGSLWFSGTAITGENTSGTVFSGSGITAANVDDQYLNTSTGNTYKCITGGNAATAKWAYTGNIKGAIGPQGPAGPTGAVDENTPITFSQAASRSNINSGESIATIAGKIKKWFADLKAAAFCGVANNGTTTEANYVLDARMGKTLTDKTTELENKITELNGKTVNIKSSPPWTTIEYPNNLIMTWRYATVAASGQKTNTLALPTPMNDNQYNVQISPVFNGHLCNSIWAGSLTGGDGRTTTTVQISMDSIDSQSNVGIFVTIIGYKKNN